MQLFLFILFAENGSKDVEWNEINEALLHKPHA